MELQDQLEPTAQLVTRVQLARLVAQGLQGQPQSVLRGQPDPPEPLLGQPALLDPPEQLQPYPALRVQPALPAQRERAEVPVPLPVPPGLPDRRVLLALAGRRQPLPDRLALRGRQALQALQGQQVLQARPQR